MTPLQRFKEKFPDSRFRMMTKKDHSLYASIIFIMFWIIWAFGTEIGWIYDVYAFLVIFLFSRFVLVTRSFMQCFNKRKVIFGPEFGPLEGR